VLGLKPEQVTFHTVTAGGGFGRRATPDSHVAREAATIAKRFRGTPVKLVWPPAKTTSRAGTTVRCTSTESRSASVRTGCRSRGDT